MRPANQAHFNYPGIKYSNRVKEAEPVRFHNINIRNILSEALNYGGIIVDVRNPEEFAISHIPMAVNLPLDEIKQGNITLPRTKIILVYCENGGASTMASRLLSEKGYKVINTVGGLKDYKGALTKKNGINLK